MKLSALTTLKVSKGAKKQVRYGFGETTGIWGNIGVKLGWKSTGRCGQSVGEMGVENRLKSLGKPWVKLGRKMTRTRGEQHRYRFAVCHRGRDGYIWPSPSEKGYTTGDQKATRKTTMAV